jgi:hypothetical protein
LIEVEKADVTRRKYLEYAVGGVIAVATAFLLYYYAVELARTVQAKRK